MKKDSTKAGTRLTMGISVLDLAALCGAVFAAFIGGCAVGFAWRIFRDEDRLSTKRNPRPGQGEPRFKPYRRSKDMLDNGPKHKKE